MRHLAALVAFLALAAPASAVTFEVNSTGDQPDETTADNLCKIAGSNDCTLRAAIQQSNASTTVNDVIDFAIPVVPRIQLTSALPQITDLVTINGESEPDFDGTPLVRVDGPPGILDGLVVAAGAENSEIRGLVLVGHGVGVKMNAAARVHG